MFGHQAEAMLLADWLPDLIGELPRTRQLHNIEQIYKSVKCYYQNRGRKTLRADQACDSVAGGNPGGR